MADNLRVARACSSNTRPCSHDVPEVTIQALEVLDNLWMNVMQRYTGMLLWSKSLTVYIPYKSLCMAIVQDMTNSMHREPIKQTEKGVEKRQKIWWTRVWILYFLYYTVTNVTNVVTANTTENQHPQTLTPDKNINIGPKTLNYDYVFLHFQCQLFFTFLLSITYNMCTWQLQCGSDSGKIVVMANKLWLRYD